MEQLLRWPKALQHFEYPYRSSTSSTSYVENFLSWHKDTLKGIVLGNRYSTKIGSKLIDVTKFPVLHELTLSRWPFNYEFSEETGQMLLAPQLRKFTWDFTVYEEHSESWSFINDEVVEWLRQFCLWAVLKQSKLCQIHIIYRPDYWDYRGAKQYPWDILDRLKDEISRQGIELTYTEPTITRESWLRYQEKVRRNIESQVPGQNFSTDGIYRSEDEQSDVFDTEDTEDDDIFFDSHTTEYTDIEGGDIREYFASISD